MANVHKAIFKCKWAKSKGGNDVVKRYILSCVMVTRSLLRQNLVIIMVDETMQLGLRVESVAREVRKSINFKNKMMVSTSGH